MKHIAQIDINRKSPLTGLKNFVFGQIPAKFSAVVLICMAGCGPKPWIQHSSPYLQAAFAFASAITDEKDAAYYQEQVIKRAIATGDMKASEDFAGLLGDWRKGVVYADIAAHYLSNNDKAKAAPYLDKAEKERTLAEEWQKTRIASSIAKAYAKSGDLEKIRQIGIRMESGEEQWMTFVAYLDAMVRTQGLDSALKLAEENYREVKMFDHAFGHPASLIRILAENDRNLTPEQRKQVFSLGLKAMEKAPSSHAHALFEELINVCHKKGWTEEVQQLSDAVEARFLPPEAWSKPDRLYDLKAFQARFRAMGGQKEKALEILAGLYPHIDASAGLGFERCALMGIMIQAHMAADDLDGARKVYEKGITTAYREKNPRPRAMAYAELLMRVGETSFPMRPEDENRLKVDLSRPWTVLDPDAH
ncbi:MAG: hypothetical protein SFU85_08535 [Candidatus Methylacidiphilales bacterium]|nr:hypothetical protein [Candidatus Methylacidiphilales bacterium]